MPNKELDKPKLYETASEELPEANLKEDNDDEETLTFDLAGLNSRALAFFIDLIIISLVALLAFGIGIYVIQSLSVGVFNLGRVFMPIYLLLFFLSSSYFVILNGYGGKTIGKMLMGIRIISDEGNPIGFWQSFVRWIGYYISGSIFFIGFLWSIFDRSSQSWHDKIACTFVVKE